MKSQVTTKRGDQGETVTLGGDRYSKSHPILECNGQLDCLRTQTAALRLAVLASDHPDREAVGESLMWLLHIFFLMGSQCNDPLNKHPEYRRADVSAAHLKKLEAEQESLEKRVRLPKEFIVSASTALGAAFDVLCTQSRSLERAMVALKEAVPEFEAGILLALTNRLSDYLFLLARFFDGDEHLTVDYGLIAEEGE